MRIIVFISLLVNKWVCDNSDSIKSLHEEKQDNTDTRILFVFCFFGYLCRWRPNMCFACASAWVALDSGPGMNHPLHM
jgi:hypothetical protein